MDLRISLVKVLSGGGTIIQVIQNLGKSRSKVEKDMLSDGNICMNTDGRK